MVASYQTQADRVFNEFVAELKNGTPKFKRMLENFLMEIASVLFVATMIIIYVLRLVQSRLHSEIESIDCILQAVILL